MISLQTKEQLQQVIDHFQQPAAEEELDLRVWHIPQVGLGCTPFYAPVNTFIEAYFMLQTLAVYDMFQLVNKIKPDYTNMQGLEIFHNGEWEDYHDPKDGDFNDLEIDRIQFLDDNPSIAFEEYM